MSDTTTHMSREIAAIPETVARLLDRGGGAIAAAAKAARDLDPPCLLSVARGSSDHACTYLKYASEILLRRPMASVGPSVKSVYGADLDCRGALCITVSQSGRSPDIVTMTRSLAASGALAVAITNDADSPLAEAAQHVLPLHAGPEHSVAATKTFVASVVAGLWFIAEIRQDRALLEAIHALPATLDAALGCDWQDFAAAIDGAPLYILGRGPSWAVALEAALKFKETCLIQAASYSSAEVMHGPVSIVAPGFPVLAFAAADAAEQTVADIADALADKGAAVFATTDRVAQARALPVVRSGHWLTDPLALVVPFYAMVERIARSRGINPDAPRHLRKVTQTT